MMLLFLIMSCALSYTSEVNPLSNPLIAMQSVLRDVGHIDREESTKKQEFCEAVHIYSRVLAVLPSLYENMKYLNNSSRLVQHQLICASFLRVLVFYGAVFRYHAQNKKYLTSSQFKKLKNTVREYELCLHTLEYELGVVLDFPMDKSRSLTHIGGQKIHPPMKIYVQDDDTGKHISVFELPMIYGFGEDETEALHMLEREIISMREELNEDDDMTDELSAVKDFLNTVFDEK